MWTIVEGLVTNLSDPIICSSFTGLKEMLKICEDFADDHDIIFNASKSQLLQFISCSNNINMKPVLQMRTWSENSICRIL